MNPEYINYLEMNELACGCRRSWNIDINESIDIFSLAINKIKNLTIVFKKMDNKISGACLKVADENIIFVNSLHRKGRQAFTIAHELYHLKFDKNSFNVCGIISDDEEEKRADLFATCLLMPHGAIETYKLNNNIKKWDLDSIIELEQYFQISHQSLLWRLRHFLKEITYDEYINYKKDIIYNASIRGYDLSLYSPYLNKEYLTIGNYIKLTEKAYENDLISRGKKEELLLDAFREDIVYNFNLLYSLEDEDLNGNLGRNNDLNSNLSDGDLNGILGRNNDLNSNLSDGDLNADLGKDNDFNSHSQDIENLNSDYLNDESYNFNDKKSFE